MLGSVTLIWPDREEGAVHRLHGLTFLRDVFVALQLLNATETETLPHISAICDPAALENCSDAF